MSETSMRRLLWMGNEMISEGGEGRGRYRPDRDLC